MYPDGFKVPVRFDCKEGDLITEKYRLVSSLGQGAFGQVYKVEDISLRVWAMKLLRLWDVPSEIRKPLVERFEMEYKTGLIDSPFLVQASDYGFIKGNPYIVMEFCPGGDLSSKMGDVGLDKRLVLYQILQGLAALHAHGKVHRDLKPENVMFKADGTAALTDFGISGDRNKRMTERNIFGKPNQIFGTYAYMPPEQVNRTAGNSTVLPTTDIFSFGVLAYQLLSGKLPFGKLEDQNDLALYQKRLKAGEWDRFAIGSSPYLSMIEACLEPNYKSRANSVDKIIRLLPNESMVPGVQKPMIRQRPDLGLSQTSPCLKITDGEDYGTAIDLNAVADKYHRNVITAGRDDGNMILLKEISEFHTSRRHFTIERKDKMNFCIRDGQWIPEQKVWKVSSNGTFVNSMQIDENGILLHDGDLISAGDIKMIFINK